MTSVLSSPRHLVALRHSKLPLHLPAEHVVTLSCPLLLPSFTLGWRRKVRVCRALCSPLTSAIIAGLPIPAHTCPYLSIPAHTCPYLSIPAHTCPYVPHACPISLWTASLPTCSVNPQPPSSGILLSSPRHVRPSTASLPPDCKHFQVFYLTLIFL